MMSWGGSFVGRVEPPSKLVIWSGLCWGLEGVLGGKKKKKNWAHSDLSGWWEAWSVPNGCCVKTHSRPNLLAVGSAGPAARRPRMCFTEVGEFLCVCFCSRVSFCSPSFRPCVPTRTRAASLVLARTPSKPAACCSTQLHTRAFKKTPSNPVPSSPKVNTAFSLWHLPEGEDYKGAYWPGISCAL